MPINAGASVPRAKEVERTDRGEVAPVRRMNATFTALSRAALCGPWIGTRLVFVGA